MKVRHILKDGTEVPDISGHVIKADKFEVLYQVIAEVERKVNEEDCTQN